MEQNTAQELGEVPEGEELEAKLSREDLLEYLLVLERGRKLKADVQRAHLEFTVAAQDFQLKSLDFHQKQSQRRTHLSAVGTKALQHEEQVLPAHIAELGKKYGVDFSEVRIDEETGKLVPVEESRVAQSLKST